MIQRQGPAPSDLRVFVYGTLRRGYWNHQPYLGGLAPPQAASIRGHLWVQPSGSPVAKVPPSDLRALATGDLARDLALQAAPHLDAVPPPISGWDRHAPWGRVEGELYRLPEAPDRAARLGRLDELEGFHPGGECTYLRVLVPVRDARGDQVLAWVYVAEPWQDGATWLEDGVYRGRPS